MSDKERHSNGTPILQRTSNFIFNIDQQLLCVLALLSELDDAPVDAPVQ
jgi:hypothetical protein